MAVDITIGQISGAINFATVLIHFTLPLAFVLILVGYLSNENNAVTWSVISRSLQSSMWPLLLNADSVSNSGVKTRVVTLSFLSTFAILLLTVAGVVTPLGLGEAIVESDARPVPFQYVRDLSSFGIGTPSRDGYKFSRICGAFIAFPCPGAVDGGKIDFVSNKTGMYLNATPDAFLNTTLPANVTEVFTGALRAKAETVSGLLDVQYRNWRNVKDGDDPSQSISFDKGAEHTEGEYSLLQQLVLDDRYELVEGLVVDMKSGGVGFRNHTAPSGLKYGAKWSEKLLWIEPVTECTNNNLTIDFTVGYSLSGLVNAELVDQGGIAEAQREYPTFNRDNAQNDPQLAQRAFKGAWITDMLAAGYFNVTKKTKGVGKAYNLTDNFGNTPSMLKLKGISISQLSGDFFDTSLETSQNFTDANIVCQGYNGPDVVNITNIAVSCSTILGAARRRDGNPNGLRFDPGSNWTIPIYTCASALKASVKQVEFFLNRTYPELPNIQVNSISPVNYSSQAAMPLWAMERTGLAISDFTPLWGIVDDKYENSSNLFTLRRDYFWLPASYSGAMGSVSSIAGAEAPASALTAATDPGSSIVGLDTMYSGENSFAMFAKWQNLSADPGSTSTIINLIWADFMANAVMGTRSALTYESDATSGDDLGMISVVPYELKITYNMLFSIPAIITLALWIAISAIALFLWISSRVTMALLKQLINQTSTGRTVTNMLYPDVCPADAATKKWVKTAGRKTVGFTIVDTAVENSDAVLLKDFKSPITPVTPVTPNEPDSEGERGVGPALSVRSGTIKFGEVEEKRTPVGNVFKRL
ncbi:hypothetical protein RUND412_003826 [Rhizina undulata]